MRDRIPVRTEKLSAASRRSYDTRPCWEDRELKCRNCGATFSFTAEQQRDWYEGEQKHIHVQPVLCARCFLEHSRRRRLKGRMDHALALLRRSPTDEAKIEVAETVIEYFQCERRGDIRLALHLMREVLHIHPGNRRALELSWAAESLLEV